MLNLKDGRVIATIKGGKYNKQNVYLNEMDDSGKNDLNLKKVGGEFIPSCDPHVERMIWYIFGQSGSGKSTLINQIAHQFRKMRKDAPIYLLSGKDKDPSIDDIDPLRIAMNDKFLSDPISWKDFELGCMVIFDDIDVLERPFYLRCLAILKSLLFGARDRKIYICVTMHMPTSGRETSSIIFEAHAIAYFPLGGTKSQRDYVLEKFIDKKKINEIEKKDKKSRWVMYYKNYPMMYLTQRTIGMINQESSDDDDDGF